MDIIRAMAVNASAEKLWQILGRDYNNIGEWTSQVLQSTPNPNLDSGEGRVCMVNGFGNTKETLTQYDEEQHTLSYTAEIEKMPFFVKEMSNSWRVESTGQNRAIVHMHAKATLLPVFAQVMGPIIHRQITQVVDTMLEELKYYAENDEIHPRKQKQLATA